MGFFFFISLKVSGVPHMNKFLTVQASGSRSGPQCVIQLVLWRDWNCGTSYAFLIDWAGCCLERHQSNYMETNHF